MLKQLLAILAGVIAGVMTITLVEMISASFYPYPDGMDRNNLEEFKAYAKSLPAAAFALVMLGHLVGAFMGGVVATLIYRKDVKPGTVVGGVFMGFGLLNLTTLEIHPTWMWSELILYVPFAYLGAKLVHQRF